MSERIKKNDDIPQKNKCIFCKKKVTRVTLHPKWLAAERHRTELKVFFKELGQMRIYIHNEAASVKTDNPSRVEALVLKSIDVTSIFLKVWATFYSWGSQRLLTDKVYVWALIRGDKWPSQCAYERTLGNSELLCGHLPENGEFCFVGFFSFFFFLECCLTFNNSCTASVKKIIWY